MTAIVLRLEETHNKIETLLKTTEKETPERNQENFQKVKNEYRQLPQKIIEDLKKNKALNNLIDADLSENNFYSLLKEISNSQISEEKKKYYYSESELSCLNAKKTFIDEDINEYIKSLVVNESKSIIDFNKNKYADLEKEWIKLRQDLEKMERRAQFINPNIDQSEFVATLMWMIEQGEQEELNLIQKVRRNPPYSSNYITELFNLAERKIGERIKQNKKVKPDLIRAGFVSASLDISAIKEIFSNFITATKKIFLYLRELSIVEKLLDHQPMLTKKEDINLLSRIDQKEISIKINKVAIEREELILEESYNINFQVFEPEELASQKDFFQKGLEKLLASFNIKKGLDTEWVVSSSTVKLEAANNTKPSLTTTEISQGTVWAAKFPLYISIYGDSAVFPLKITPKVVQDASLSVLIYACGDLYCQLEIALNVVSPRLELLSEVAC